MHCTPFISKKYDALGRRIRKDIYASGSLDSTIWYYYNDNWQVLCEYEGTTRREFVYGNYLDEVLLMVATVDSTSTEYYYAHNHLYSPVALMEDDGDVVERYEYDAYGKPYFYNESFTLLDPQKSTKNNPVMFTGQRLDPLDAGDLPLMYYKNRYYCPTTGRFLQRDPIGMNDEIRLVDFRDTGSPRFSRTFKPLTQYKDGMSLYEYAHSKSIIYLDSFGLKAKAIEYKWRKDKATGKRCIYVVTINGHAACGDGTVDPKKDKEELLKNPPTDCIQMVGLDKKTAKVFHPEKHIPFDKLCCVASIYLKGCFVGNNKNQMHWYYKHFISNYPNKTIYLCGCTSAIRDKSLFGWVFSSKCMGRWYCITKYEKNRLRR